MVFAQITVIRERRRRTVGVCGGLTGTGRDQAGQFFTHQRVEGAWQSDAARLWALKADSEGIMR